MAHDEDPLHDSERRRIVTVNMSAPNLRVMASGRSAKDGVASASSRTDAHLNTKTAEVLVYSCSRRIELIEYFSPDGI